MKIDSRKYSVYALSDSGRHVAIDAESRKVIEHCLSIWRNLADVPVDRTVRGIFVERDSDGSWKTVGASEQQNDITLSQLVEVVTPG